MKTTRIINSNHIPIIALLSAISFQTQSAINFIDSGQALGSGTTVRTDLVDVDGDGDLDAMTANYGQADIVWLNDGSGTLTDSGQTLGGTRYNWDICTADLDGDGDVDAGYAHWNNSVGSAVFTNDGAGLFTDTAQVLYPLQAAGGCEFGDLDGDGDLDLFLFVAAYSPHNDRVFLNDGTGTFTDTNQTLDNLHSYGGTLSDLDGDGDLDAMVANASSPSDNTIWLNDGTGTFTDSGQTAGNDPAWSVVAGDIDGDGDNDIVVPRSSGGDSRIFLNNGSAVFTDSGQLLAAGSAVDAALGDLDGDGDLDIVFANLAGANKVFENDGSGTFTDAGLSLGTDASGGVSLADLDGDGDLDIYESVYSVPNANKVWVNGSTGVVQYSAVSHNAAESDGTATITVTRANGGTGAATVDYSTADDTATEPSDYTSASGTLSWADGETGAKTFTVTINSDSENESDETVGLRLSNPVGVSLGTNITATLTIQNTIAPEENETQPAVTASVVNDDDGVFGVGSTDPLTLLLFSIAGLSLLSSRRSA